MNGDRDPCSSVNGKGTPVDIAPIGCSLDVVGSNHRDTDIGEPSPLVCSITGGKIA